jgi:hypothetical protein
VYNAAVEHANTLPASRRLRRWTSTFSTQRVQLQSGAGTPDDIAAKQRFDAEAARVEVVRATHLGGKTLQATAHKPAWRPQGRVDAGAARAACMAWHT